MNILDRIEDLAVKSILSFEQPRQLKMSKNLHEELIKSLGGKKEKLKIVTSAGSLDIVLVDEKNVLELI